MLLRREAWYPAISSESECCQGILIEQRVLGTNAGKTTVLSCHRCIIITGVEKMNYI
jgi:hypothetical protein